MLSSLLTNFAAACTQQKFFDLPTWYKYLLAAGRMAVDPATGRCEVKNTFGVADFSLIALAVVDILLRVAAFVAIAYVIWGGIQFVTAQGESDKTKRARQTIINALIGLVVAMVATGIVTFIGTRIK